jgi:hypothetical protein
MRERRKKLEEKLKEFNVDEIASYGIILMYLNGYLKSKRGRLERILERIIKSYAIYAKHNPYYGGAFNGKDCMII